MTNTPGPLREAQRLRVKMQMNNRLHLEVMAALSKTFRDNHEKVSDGLLRNLVFAVPEELPGEGALSKSAIMMPLQAAPIPPQPAIPPQPFGLARPTTKKKSKKAAKKKKSSKKASKKR